MLKHFLDPRCWKNAEGTDYHDWVLLATTSLLLLAAPAVDGFDIREYKLPLFNYFLLRVRCPVCGSVIENPYDVMNRML